MTTYEQDPDVLRWGLQLFDGDPFSYCGYNDAVTQNNSYCNEQYLKDDFLDTSSYTENGEHTVSALQEGLSQLSVADAYECPRGGVEHLQTSFCAQDWFTPPSGVYAFGSDNGFEETNGTGPSCSRSSSTGNSYGGEDWSYDSYPIELMDEFSLDGEVGKRLTQMVPIPHIPRINGEIPSVDEATLDHQRLLDRLQVYQLVEFKVLGDGNCQFRALSDQFYRTPEHHEFVRQQIVNQLKSEPERYEGYVPMGYNDYLEKMSKSGEWGDHVTLQAASDSYGVKIFVVASFKDTCYIEILPSIQKSNRVIFLSFWAEVHYNSIYPEGDVPAVGIKKRRRRNLLKSVVDHRTNYQPSGN